MPVYRTFIENRHIFISEGLKTIMFFAYQRFLQAYELNIVLQKDKLYQNRNCDFTPHSKACKKVQ